MAKKILVIDDDKMVVTMLFVGFEKKGYEVFIAENGEKGMEIMHEHSLDLIILDIEMPEMNGYTFILELKKKPAFKNTSVIILTSHPDMQPIFELKDIKGYILKPVNLDDILEKVKECIGS